jgi:hypothetical protein
MGAILGQRGWLRYAITAGALGAGRLATTMSCLVVIPYGLLCQHVMNAASRRVRYFRPG